MIKKLLIWLALPLMIAGCSQSTQMPSTPQAAAMQLTPAALSEQEAQIAALMGNVDDLHLFDYAVDTPEMVAINYYRLENGAWQLAGTNQTRVSQAKGRIALRFSDLSQRLTTAIQSGNDTNTSGMEFPTASSPTDEVAEEAPSVATGTSFLTEPTDIVLGTEIPLAIQVHTTAQEFSAYGTHAFFTPEKYADNDFEAVFAVTVLFFNETI